MHRSSCQARLETLHLWTRRARRHFGSLPSRTGKPFGKPKRGVEVRTKSAGAAKWQRVTKSGFHPSVQEIKRGTPEREPCTCSLGQDRSLYRSPRGPRRPLFISSYKTAGCHPFIEQSKRNDRRGMVSYLSDIRKTNTDVPTTASTPGKECLTSLTGLAKGILALGSIFRARSLI